MVGQQSYEEELHTNIRVKKMSEPIFPASPGVATYQTNISGWVDRHGRFWGEDEYLARFNGSTHKKCECGNVIEKNGYCKPCSERKSIEIFNKYPTQEITDKYLKSGCPFYSDLGDAYYWGIDDLFDKLLDSGNPVSLENIRLQFCKPIYARELDEDYFCDELPEDGDIPPEIREAMATFNAMIRGIVLSYEPASIRVDCDQLRKLYDEWRK